MDNAGRIDEFICLLTGNEPRLRSYVLTLVPNWSDAEEILQETNIVLWRKFDEFRPGSNFFAWACIVARYEVLSFRKRKSRDRLVFSDEFIHDVAVEIEGMAGELADRQNALVRCLKKLPEGDRKLIGMRYTIGSSVRSIAEEVGRSADAVYKALTRIRRNLFRCVEHTLASGDSNG